MNWRDEWKTRWPNFEPEELLSPNQLQQLVRRGVFVYSFRALDKLQAFRVGLGVPLKINGGGQHRRGARSVDEVIAINRTVRNVSPYAYSFHLWCAFDVSSTEMEPLEIREHAIASKLWGGIGLYDTWVHLDDRDNFFNAPTLWDSRSRK